MSWIGVDLDGTLARYDGWVGPESKHIGEPIPAMLARVRAWLAEGKQVKIFTARACIPEQIPPVQEWLAEHGLYNAQTHETLEVTCSKDFAMTELWDDLAITVEKNTGKVLVSRWRES